MGQCLQKKVQFTFLHSCAMKSLSPPGALCKAHHMLQVSKEALERKAGPDPSVAELLDTMDSMHLMIAKQSHAEQQIMEKLTYSTPEDDMSQILRFFHGAPPHDAN